MLIGICICWSSSFPFLNIYLYIVTAHLLIHVVRINVRSQLLSLGHQILFFILWTTATFVTSWSLKWNNCIGDIRFQLLHQSFSNYSAQHLPNPYARCNWTGIIPGLLSKATSLLAVHHLRWLAGIYSVPRVLTKQALESQRSPEALPNELEQNNRCQVSG